MAIVVSGNPLTGTEDNDYILDHPGNSPDNTLSGLGGSDLILADFTDFYATADGDFGSTALTAFDITSDTNFWTVSENAEVTDAAIPHASILFSGEAGVAFWSVSVVAGAQITLDVDFGDDSTGNFTDTTIEIYAADGITLLASNDNAATADVGSFTTFDAFLQHTFADAGTYIIRLVETNDGTNAAFESDDDFLLNISLTGQAANGTPAVIGNDILIGGLGQDFMAGNGGDDTFVYGTGYAGSEYVSGGSGTDTLQFGNGGASYDANLVDATIVSIEALELTSAGAGGTATVRLKASQVGTGISPQATVNFSGLATVTETLRFTLDGSENINLSQFTFSGNSAEDTIVITGGTGTNTIDGSSITDIIDGGTGADIMRGRGGNDTYYVDSLTDFVDESVASGGGGTDTVISSVNVNLTVVARFLGAIENAEITGTTATEIVGNGLANTLTGNAQGNQLNGNGGADTMIGKAGNDIYFIDNAGDVVDESLASGGAGADQANSGNLNIDLNNATMFLGDIENIRLLDSANLNAFGNGFGNVIRGNAGNNTIDGRTGADTMRGEGGNDTYHVDDAGDIVDESVVNLGGGVDTVISSVNVNLTDGVHFIGDIEKVTLTGTAISVVGNGLANTLIGNAENNHLRGGGGADSLDGLTGADTMIGGEGDDTYTVDDAGDIVDESMVNLGSGFDTINASVSVDMSDGVHFLGDIEKVTLTGTAIGAIGNGIANTLTGNAENNQLSGGGGADILDGLTGADTMIGGADGDTYYIDDVGDLVDESLANGGGGIDTVISSVSVNLTVTSRFLGDIENVTLTGAAYELIGNAIANTLTGTDDSNQINGLGGGDTLIGRGGGDLYIINGTDDVVDERVTSGGAGIDMVLGGAFDIDLSNTTMFLGDIENIRIIYDANVSAKGNGLDNDIEGSNGNNLLDGRVGADTMRGMAGNDTYVVDNVLDIVDELAGDGTDLVQSSIDFSLAISATVLGDVENLTLTGIAVSGTGNDLANVLTGNAVANILGGGLGGDTLNGLGGRDRLTGGDGSDTYFADVSNEIIVETTASLAIGGNDLVNYSGAGTFVLSANVERLTLTHASVNVNGTGNALANTITGNAGRNVLNGGLGKDTLIGGRNNDTYIVDLTDIVTEAAGSAAGTADLIQWAGLNNQVYVLRTNVENLTLTGSAATKGTGNVSNNVITGNIAANVLSGANGNDTLIGGRGKDILIGGLHNDTFRFLTKLDSSANHALADRIADFDDPGKGNDTIDLAGVYGPALTYIHAAAFTKAGQVRINDIRGADVIVEVNTGGTLAADFAIRLTGTTLASMTKTDFVL